MHLSKKANFRWCNKLAYCVGLLVSDGNLSKDNRHITFVSKDLDQVKKFKYCLNLENKIAVKNSGFNKQGKYYYVQFGNVVFYRWLNSIGIKANKSKSISEVKVPDTYFFSFLRGLLDGDGCITSFNHPESSKPQIRLKFCSGSKEFIVWLESRITRLASMRGKITRLQRVYELIYYKSDSIKLLLKIYNKAKVFLDRKFVKAKALLAGVVQLADTYGLGPYGETLGGPNPSARI